MSRWEFISKFWNSCLSRDEFEFSDLSLIPCHDYLINVSRVFPIVPTGLSLHLNILLENLPTHISRHDFIQVNIPLRYLRTYSHNSIRIQSMLLLQSRVQLSLPFLPNLIGFRNSFLHISNQLQTIINQPHLHDSRIPSVNTSLVQHHRIFNIIPRVTHNCYLRVLASRQLIKINEIQCFRLNHRLLRVHIQIQQRVKPQVLVIPYHTYSLLAHGTLVCVSRGLIVMGVRD